MKRLRMIVLGMLILSWVGLGRSHAAATPKSGGTLRFAIASDLLGLNPFQGTLSINKDVGSLAFECLLTSDPEGNIKPSVASAWETSKDGLQYTFKLRKGVKFHNGKDLTAEDIVWAIEYAQDPKNGAYGRDKLKAIQSVIATDPGTVHITLKEPYVPFLTSLSSGFDAFPVVPKGSVPFGREKMTMHPPGTGPFMMTEYKPNQSLVFKKFDQYWQKGIPYLDAVNFKVVEDSTVRFTALRAGDFDVIERLPYEQVLRVRKGEIKDIGLEFAEGSGYKALIFNTEKPPFNNVKLRQAVAYAIDKAKIFETITWGLGPVTTQKVPPKSRWWVPIEDRKRDLAKARALIKEAGHSGGLKLVARVSKGWPNPEIMQIVQSQLKEVGIDIEIELVDFAKNQQDKRTGEFEIAPLGGLTYPDPDLAYYQYFHTEQTPIKVSNFPRYSNPRVDKLLEQGRVEPDFQKRYRIYKEFIEIIHEEVPQISLGSNPYVFAYRSYVKGFEVFPDDHFFYGVGGIGMTWMDR